MSNFKVISKEGSHYIVSADRMELKQGFVILTKKTENSSKELMGIYHEPLVVELIEKTED